MKIAKVQTTVREINQLQQNIATAAQPIIDAISKSPFANGGQILTNIPIINGGNVIQHSLGYIPSGYLVTYQNASISLYQVSWTTKTLTLFANAPGTVNLYVF